MPLRSLWNKLKGQSSGSEQSAKSAQTDRATIAAEPTAVGKSPDPIAAVTKAATAKPAVAGKQAPARKLGLLGGSSPHASLLKQLRGQSVSSVLEIDVEDGSRAVEVFQTLSESAKTSVRYFAVDQFELGRGATTLRQFHRTTRGAGVQVHVFPEPAIDGLMRFAHTIGTADLILVCDPAAHGGPQFASLLSRVSDTSTRIFLRQNQTWKLADVNDFAGQIQHRRAA